MECFLDFGWKDCLNKEKKYYVIARKGKKNQDSKIMEVV